MGKEGPEEKTRGCGVAGEVLKGTAAGWSGEENAGGPGGVLRRGKEPGVLIAFPGEGTLGTLMDGEGIWLDCSSGGGGNLDPPVDEERGRGGGLSSPGLEIVTGYGRGEDWGRSAIENRGEKIPNSGYQSKQHLDQETPKAA